MLPLTFLLFRSTKRNEKHTDMSRKLASSCWLGSWRVQTIVKRFNPCSPIAVNDISSMVT